MKELIGVSYSGLADRIMMLLAGARLAKDVGAKFTFIWPVNDSCGAKFEDVLRVKPDGDPFSVNIEDEDYKPGVSFFHANDMSWQEVKEVVNNWTHSDALKLCAYPKEFDMDDFGKVIDFSFPVQTHANHFASENGFDDATIGVHIRARDLADKTPLVGEYVSAVAKLREKTNGSVFLATDCPIVRNWFFSLGSGVFHRSFTFDRSKPEAVIYGAIELALLRKCKRLVLSGYSGFSRMACHTCQAPSEGVLIVDRT